MTLGPIEEYLIPAGKDCYGLRTVEIRQMAYRTIGVKMCDIRSEKKKAVSDWFASIRSAVRGHLSMDTTEATSLGRTINFSPHRDGKFFDKEESVLVTNECDQTSLDNEDEAEVTNVQILNKVITHTDSRQT